MSTLRAAALSTLSGNRVVEAHRLNPMFRGELDWLLMKALEKDRSRRYESAGELARDVERYLHDEPVQACPPSAGYRLRKFGRRKRGPVGTGLAFVTLLALGTVGQTPRPQ